MASAQEFDYVVVGAGSAGCVVAARLSESDKHTVALVEAGGEDKGFWMHVPLGYGKLYTDRRVIWPYESEPESELGGAKLYQPRGRVLGGSSSINGMMYVRGPRQDFDHWRELGNVGWGYDDVLPFFKKAEDNERGASEYHGVGGPLRVSNTPRHEMADAFIASAVAAGYPRNEDLNGATQEGFGYNQLTTHAGRRWSTAVAYLHPARHRANLHVVTHALVSRILVRNGEAVGIEFNRDGVKHSLSARREVILCGGSINSPKLLQLSGIGPANLLRNFDIPVLLDAKGVGSNLQDHFGVQLTFRCNKPITLNDQYKTLAGRLKMGMQYVLFRKGPLSANAGFTQGFIRTEPNLRSPDLTMLMWLWSMASSGKRHSERVALNPYPGVTLMVVNPHPESRGSVRIRSTDPAEAPELRFNHLVSERDRRLLVKGFRIARRIMSLPPIASYIVEEDDPGPKCVSDEDIVDHIRRRGRSTHHTTATCRMGVDPDAVVDPRLRVKGVHKLRIVDASIMPAEISGNTNAATIMIGEKGAAMILDDAGQPALLRRDPIRDAVSSG